MLPFQLLQLVATDSSNITQIGSVTFEPGARTNWHLHPAGQIQLAIDGTGYYQEKGSSKRLLRKGDVVKCPPNVPHWHGASRDQKFIQVAITNTQNGSTVWLQRVTDEEYRSIKIKYSIIKLYAMKVSIPGLCILLISVQWASAQQTKVNLSAAELEIINLSKQKWLWMAGKNVDSLNTLFDEKSVFVHMGGSWGKEPELNVIKSEGIWYKKADIHSVSVNIIGNTAILLNNITLLAVVGGNEVKNPFIATEVYIKENGKWMLGSLSFTRLLTPDNAH